MQAALGLLGLRPDHRRAASDVAMICVAQSICVAGLILLLATDRGAGRDAGATMAIFGGMSVCAECVRLLLRSQAR